ncbi:hypothetical protein SNOG_09771 [Parastagonospora nodorum SN15]|uniref:Uncharacterized protein n=1 Tax=Phaeosphaeria nodorum (strain SN15 / ATCC MYA-4574 / FGSC 10173) TaxID=321614 RepID=Q0UEP3_PHANO|nr:hypothetical protein SNOG_09771 [Parastagonospora nodorum SN15]EAT83036.1 hypothetical protein SNOG_09771 [Parastagonospora nodorum SN15]
MGYLPPGSILGPTHMPGDLADPFTHRSAISLVPVQKCFRPEDFAARKLVAVDARQGCFAAWSLKHWLKSKIVESLQN